MESISNECTPLKNEYEHCFNKWYTDKFLKGEKDDDCKELFEKYRECISTVLAAKGLQKMVNDARPHIDSPFAVNESADSQK